MIPLTVFHKLVYLTVLVGCGAYALWRGGAPERLAAACFAISNLLTPFVQLASTRWADRLDPGVMLVDMLTLVAFVWLTARANRYWPIYVTALHLLGFLGHLSRWLTHTEMNAWGYHVLTSQGGYAIWPLIAVGAYRHHRRTRIYGADRAWELSLNAWTSPQSRPRRDV